MKDLKIILPIILIILLVVISLGIRGCYEDYRDDRNQELWQEESKKKQQEDLETRLAINKQCESGDFDAAYMLASTIHDYSVREETEKRIVKNECIYVIDNEKEAGLVRIDIILKEHKAENMYPELLDFAISINDESLATKLFKISGKCSEHTMNYAISAEMKDLVLNIIEVVPDYISDGNVIAFLREKGLYERFELERQKKQAEIAAKEEEARREIAAKKEEARREARREEEQQQRNRLEKEYNKLKARRIEGVRPNPGLNNINYGKDILEAKKHPLDASKENIIYYQSVSKYNSDCLSLLAEAINAKDKNRAQQIVTLIKENIEITLGDNTIIVDNKKIDIYHSYIKYTNTDKKQAQQQFNDAIKQGLFK